MLPTIHKRTQVDSYECSAVRVPSDSSTYLLTIDTYIIRITIDFEDQFAVERNAKAFFFSIEIILLASTSKYLSGLEILRGIYLLCYKMCKIQYVDKNDTRVVH